MITRRIVMQACLCLLFCGSLAAQESAPRSVNEYVSLGRSLLAEGKTAEAIELLRQATEAYPTSQSVQYFLAGAYWAAGEPEHSMQCMLRRQELSAEVALQELLAEQEDQLVTTASEVIELHIEAIGGREALAAVHTMVVEFTANSTAGSVATIRRQYKRPYLYRQEVIGSARFMATDGHTVWQVAEGQWQEIDEPSYARMSSIENFFLDYADFGVSYDFVGAEIFNDTPVYHLERTFRDAVRQDLFFAIETGLLTEIRSAYPAGNPMMESVMSLWDYRDVGGIRIPHVFIRNVGRLGPPHGGVVQQVLVNPTLEDSLFVKP